MKNAIKLAVIFLVLSIQIFPQIFDLNAYKQFQQSTQNLTTQQLYQMHPAGEFKASIGQAGSILYYDTISSKYQLTNFEKQLIAKHGFMVSERLKYESFGDAVVDVFFRDLPVFISTDAILHAVHRSYDDMLMTIEGEYLIQKVKELLFHFRDRTASLQTKYGAIPEMIVSLKDYDFYFTVALSLLQPSVQPYYADNAVRVNNVITLINNQIPQEYSFFGEDGHMVDFSQFKPRGHYAEPYNLEMYPLLDDYFKSLIWLGRTEIYLLKPALGHLEKSLETQRSSILAALILESAKSQNGLAKYSHIDNIIKSFVGSQDNVTIENLDYLWSNCNLVNANELLDSNKLFMFQDSLLANPFAFQLINSQIIVNGTESDSIVPASAFMLLGQRFIIDSYVTGSVVYDKIKFNGQLVRRMLPNTLDVLFTLGNNAAGKLLQGDIDNYHYAANLANLRYLVNGYDDTFWGANVFNTWLNSIRKLNPPDSRNNLPEFMQTAAFWQQKMNTQLASWTELRHDNLLYAKQSYTPGPVCFFPHSYVEPFPEFYSSLKNFASKLSEVISPLEFNKKNMMIYYCNNFTGVMDTLQMISEKELHNLPFTEQEQYFLKGMIRYSTTPYSSPFDGWYYRLFFDEFKFRKKDFLTADIHTSPYDAGGSLVGWVKHVGTGPINLGVFTANYNGTDIAFVGPLYSYYDYTSSNFLRLTDAEWTSGYISQALRPGWVNLYLADTMGNTKPAGPTLLTNVKESGSLTPENFVITQNFPNPFNPSTTIAFKIPSDLTNQFVELKIYDMTGSVVQTLVSEKLPSGNYTVEWNALNDKNKKVSSGNYIYRITVGNISGSGKMTLLK